MIYIVKFWCKADLLFNFTNKISIWPHHIIEEFSIEASKELESIVYIIHA